MSEVGGLLWLLAGLTGLCAAAALAASCLRLRSPLEFLLATYVLAWSWLIIVSFALSPARILTRASLLACVGAGVAAASTAWIGAGRPPPPALGPAFFAVRSALRAPAVRLLALAVTLGAAYGLGLAFFTPVNEGDSLAYHLTRAAFWRQEHGLGYVGDAVDVRLNGNPPNAEIGQLATMVLAGSDRYVALPQLAAYGALVACVAGLARGIGLGAREALFGALVFAALPVVVVQASGALNDLVVASFLAIAGFFALRPGRAPLVLFALALGLALGTKLTAVLALPALAVVVAIANPRRRSLALALGGVGGVVLGSTWYVVNLVEAGQLDGGLEASSDQRLDLTPSAVATNALRLVLDLVDLSGAPGPYRFAFLAVACALAAVGAFLLRSAPRRGIAWLVAAAVTASPVLAPAAAAAGREAVFRTWVVLGRPETAPFETGWGLNVQADPVHSWYGPLGTILLVLGPVVVAVLLRRRELPRLSLAFALAPWLVLAMLALTIVWDPFRGRFLVIAVALAAATWGTLLRWPALSIATAALAIAGLVLALANYQGKASGIGVLLGTTDPQGVSVRPIWGAERSEAQARLRPGGDEGLLFPFVAETVPADASIAVAGRENDLISPYFGPRLSRHVSLVRGDGGVVPAEADWLVAAPGSRLRRCPPAWRRELRLESGWRIERRIGTDDCDVD